MEVENLRRLSADSDDGEKGAINDLFDRVKRGSKKRLTDSQRKRESATRGKRPLLPDSSSSDSSGEESSVSKTSVDRIVEKVRDSMSGELRTPTRSKESIKTNSKEHFELRGSKAGSQ